MKVTSKILDKTQFYGLETQGGAFLHLYYLAPVFERRRIIAYQLKPSGSSFYEKVPQHTTHFLIRDRVDPREYKLKNVSTGDVLEPVMFKTTTSARKRIYYLVSQSIRKILGRIDFSGYYDVEMASSSHQVGILMRANTRLKERSSLSASLVRDIRSMGLSVPINEAHPNYPKVGDFYGFSPRGYLSGMQWTLMRVLSVNSATDTATLVPVEAKLMNPEHHSDFPWTGEFKATKKKVGPEETVAIFPSGVDGRDVSLKPINRFAKVHSYIRLKLDSKGQFYVRQKGYLDVSNEW